MAYGIGFLGLGISRKRRGTCLGRSLVPLRTYPGVPVRTSRGPTATGRSCKRSRHGLRCEAPEADNRWRDFTGLPWLGSGAPISSEYMRAIARLCACCQRHNNRHQLNEIPFTIPATVICFMMPCYPHNLDHGKVEIISRTNWLMHLPVPGYPAA